MTTVIDLTYTYTTKYTQYDEKIRTHVQKTVTINGQPGKKIRIDSLKCTLAAEKEGIVASVLVTAEVAGIDYRLAEWKTSKTAAQNKSASPAFLVDEGKGVVLRWHLKTSNTAYKAIMKVPEYSYSFVDVEKPEPEPKKPDPQFLVTVSCSSETEANELIKTLKTSTQDYTIFKQA